MKPKFNIDLSYAELDTIVDSLRCFVIDLRAKFLYMGLSKEETGKKVSESVAYNLYNELNNILKKEG